MSSLPKVSVVIPMLNERPYIRGCLDSLLANDYPRDLLEILVVDGGSTDGSREIVLDYSRTFPFIRLLDNPRRIVPVALNIGFREATGDIIVRADAHTRYAPDYIRQCVELLLTTGASNVGGVQRAVGTNYISRAIAAAVSTPFGAGDAYYRYVEKETWVDTVYLGAWRKATLTALGGFREDMEANEDYEFNVRLRMPESVRGSDQPGPFNVGLPVNQDYELNYRVRKYGGKILLSPRIRCWYYVRPSLRALSRQYFRYGFWKVRTLVLHPESLRWRQLAPPALVMGLALSGVAAAFHSRFWFVIPAVYTAANVSASLYTAARKGWIYAPALPVVFATVHLSWGLGFLAGILKWGMPRWTFRTLVKAFGPAQP